MSCYYKIAFQITSNERLGKRKDNIKQIAWELANKELPELAGQLLVHLNPLRNEYEYPSKCWRKL